MKASKQCPKCDSLRVGRLETVLDRAHAGIVLEATLGHTKPQGNWIMKNFEFVGTLEAFVCAECGYHETYVKDPDTIDFDSIDGFQWLNPPPPAEGPYR